jgi:uncharacterized protein YjdB
MQFFSRKKALLTASLAALGGLAGCGDNVTVPVPPLASIVITITPQNASMNIGESLNFAVQITGGSTTTPPTLASCSTSNAAVATASVNGAACKVTAVAAGNATVTAAASTGQQASSAVSVTAQAAAISNLTLSPTAANLGPAQTVTITPNVIRGAAANTVTYTYTTSSTAIATLGAVGANGSVVVTAVAPGVATITATAAGSGTGFSNATLTGAVTINVGAFPAGITTLTVSPTGLALAVAGTAQLSSSVSQPAGAPAATIAYSSDSPAIATVNATTGLVTAVATGNTNIRVKATSAANASFAASSIEQLVAVQVAQPAQVSIGNITMGTTNNPVDITNVQGQIQVSLNVTPNGQNVSSVQVYVCDPAATVAACTATGQPIAAQQSFGANGGNLSVVNLFINTAEFDLPNFVTGANANTFYKNGLKTIVATVLVGTQANASNNISNLNFNNVDGFAVQITKPTNKAQGAADQLTYYGGPDTPDTAIAGATSGTGRFVVVPVIYTPSRDIRSVALQFANGNCGLALTDSVRPFGITFGTLARNTAQASLNEQCLFESSTQWAPMVTASVDNQNDPGPTVTSAVVNNAQSLAGFALGTFYRPTAAQGYEVFPVDYAAPVISILTVAGGGALLTPDSGWVNGAYAFNSGSPAACGAATGNGRYCVADAGVGLLINRNTSFSVFPATSFSAVTGVFSGAPVAVGPLAATVGSINLGESAVDFTNSAYVLRASETDRLGNRRTTVPTNGTIAQNPAANNAPFFGVDVTPPIVFAIPGTGAGTTVANSPFPNFARTDVDSIYSSVAFGNTYGTTNATNAVFAVRFTDTRSGFPQCNNATNCPAFAANGPAQVRGGTFQIVRRTAPASPSLTNDALVQNIVNTSTLSGPQRVNVINATVMALDNSVREFSVNIFGDGTNNRAPNLLAPAVSAAQAGYYTFSGTLVDRAGNSVAVVSPSRSVAIDNATPLITGITVPAVLNGGTSVAFGPTGTDDLEDISGDLALRYPQMAFDFGNGAAVVGQPATIRFRRVPNFTAGLTTDPRFGLFHNPFASLVDNKLTTPVGPGTLLGATQLTVPIPFIQQIQVVTNANAPLIPGLVPVNIKPDQVTAWLYDIRATMDPATSVLWADQGRSAALSAAIFPAQVGAPATAKDWTVAAGGSGITAWSAFNPSSSSSTVEFRATMATSTSPEPFTSVSIVRQVGATEWEFLGRAVAAGALDQGGIRFWRYIFTPTSQSQGQFVTAAFANGDVVRGIGVDAAGNGLSSANVTIGLPPALGAADVINNTAPATPYTNAAAAQAIALTVAPNANVANLVFGCSSNSGFLTAAMTGPTTCTLTPTGVVASGSVPVAVTFTATGSGGLNAPSNPTTITKTVNVSRTP